MPIKGNDRILFIKQGQNFQPIACLTNNGFQEGINMFQTTTRASGGWNTSLPDNQNFSLSFTGINQLSGVSAEILQTLKRNRIKIIWGIGTADTIVEQGFGHITEITIDDEVNQDSIFSGSIEGFGKPERIESAIGANINDFLADFNGDLIAD